MVGTPTEQKSVGLGPMTVNDGGPLLPTLEPLVTGIHFIYKSHQKRRDLDIKPVDQVRVDEETHPLFRSVVSSSVRDSNLGLIPLITLSGVSVFLVLSFTTSLTKNGILRPSSRSSGPMDPLPLRIWFFQGRNQRLLSISEGPT